MSYSLFDLPLVIDHKPNGDLKRSQRVNRAFVQVVHVKREGGAKRVFIHFVGASLDRVHACDKWCLSRLPVVYGNGHPDEIHLLAKPAAADDTALANHIFMHQNGTIGFGKKAPTRRQTRATRVRRGPRSSVH